MRALVGVALLVLASCSGRSAEERARAPLPRRYDLTLPPPPRCRADGSVTDTVPDLNVPRRRLQVFVVQRHDAPPFEQKAEAALRQVAVDQGGALVDEPGKADLVLVARAIRFTVAQDTIKRVPTVSRTFGSTSVNTSILRGPSGWALSSYTTVSEVPLVVTTKTEVAKLRIDVYRLAQTPPLLRYVWQGELQTSPDNFREATQDCVSMLFGRFGGPDGEQRRPDWE